MKQEVYAVARELLLLDMKTRSNWDAPDVGRCFVIAERFVAEAERRDLEAARALVDAPVPDPRQLDIEKDTPAGKRRA